MTDQQEPPGPPVKWETINRQYDKDDRLISERVITTADVQLDKPEPDRHVGFYL